MLKASATEAVANLNEKTNSAKVNPADVKTFLSDSEKGKAKEETVSKRTKVITREDEKNVVFEAMDEKAKLIVHRSYVKKQ